MNNTSKTLAAVLAGTALVGGALVALAGPASAVGARYTGTPIGTLELRPSSGTNQSAIDYTSSAACPGGTSFETRLFGAGMPDAGEIVTARTTAGFSTSGPISSSFSNTPQFFADKNSATLSGSYDVVLRCVDRFGDTSRGDFHRVITFSSPTAYTSAGGGSASPSPSATRSASPSPSGSASPSASPSASASASPSASVTPSATPTGSPAAPSCTVPGTVSLERDTIIATGSGGVTVRATPNSVVRLFAYSRPSTTYREVRAAELGADGTASFRVSPPTNTRLYAQQDGCAAGDSVVLNVRTQLSMNVVRNGTRDYTFSGRALPARSGGLIVSLYRVTDGGRQVLTAQTRADASTGAYTIRRAFTGDGRFGFVVRTGQDLQNAPGTSNLRSLLVF